MASYQIQAATTDVPRASLSRLVGASLVLMEPGSGGLVHSDHPLPSFLKQQASTSRSCQVSAPQQPGVYDS